MNKTSTSTVTLADQLGAHFSRLQYADLTADTRKAVKRLLLDYIGVAVSGSQTESGKVARAFAAVTGGHAEATLIGGTGRVPAMQAAFANAISSHSVELDDIDVLALFHFSPPVYSAALATAEQTGASGKDLLVALAAGCEMMERLSKAANSSLRNRGFHTTPSDSRRRSQARSSGDALNAFGNTRPLLPMKVGCPSASLQARNASGGNASTAAFRRGSASR